jgi:RNA polymerase sigma-70 factor (ECF subfamily)
MPPDDEAALARARGGEEDAFRLLVERHGRSLYRLAYRLTGTREDAEDVVQEAFVRAYRQLGRFESRSNVATWLYRIGFNCAIDHLRARPRHVFGEATDVLERRPAPSAAPAADDLVFAGEIGERVQTALNTLTDLERAAFVMRHCQGCSIDEICEALDLRSNAAKHSIFRAVKKMRDALRPLMSARLEG